MKKYIFLLFIIGLCGCGGLQEGKDPTKISYFNYLHKLNNKVEEEDFNKSPTRIIYTKANIHNFDFGGGSYISKGELTLPLFKKAILLKKEILQVE